MEKGLMKYSRMCLFIRLWKFEIESSHCRMERDTKGFRFFRFFLFFWESELFVRYSTSLSFLSVYPIVLTNSLEGDIREGTTSNARLFTRLPEGEEGSRISPYLRFKNRETWILNVLKIFIRYSTPKAKPLSQYPFPFLPFSSLPFPLPSMSARIGQAIRQIGARI